jgi:hypothetical protein
MTSNDQFTHDVELLIYRMLTGSILRRLARFQL